MWTLARTGTQVLLRSCRHRCTQPGNVKLSDCMVRESEDCNMRCDTDKGHVSGHHVQITKHHPQPVTLGLCCSPSTVCPPMKTSLEEKMMIDERIIFLGSGHIVAQRLSNGSLLAQLPPPHVLLWPLEAHSSLCVTLSLSRWSWRSYRAKWSLNFSMGTTSTRKEKMQTPQSL